MKKIYIITESIKDHRAIRLSEESLKIKNVEFITLSVYNIVITSKNLYYEGQILNFKDDDRLWFLSNATINHFLIKKIKEYNPNIIMWPSSDALKYADKFLTAIFFEKLSIPTPQTVLVNNMTTLQNAVNYVGDYPLIIKKNVGSLGNAVAIAHNDREIKEFIEQMFICTQQKDLLFNRISFMLQELKEESKGVDYRALCLDGEVLGVIRREAQNGDFKANISLGGKATNIPIDPEIKKMCKKIMKEGNIFYAGIDFLKTNNGFVALEINTSAQFKGFEKATGINVAERIIKKLLSDK